MALSPSFLLAQAIFQPNLVPYKYSNIFKPNHWSYLCAYEDGNEYSETSAYKIQTPRNYPEESIPDETKMLKILNPTKQY
jgi:hypothetical protein